MRKATVSSRTAWDTGRLDARFYTSPGWELRSSLMRGGERLARLGGAGGLGSVRHPTRFKRVYAGPNEASVAFLRATDIFNYLPTAADWLAAEPAADLEPYRITEGTILQTRSGRNLGPLTLADGHLSQFVLTDDIIRLVIDDPSLRYYTLGLLRTSAGQDILRCDDTGSVVNHLSADQVSNVAIPILDDLVEPVAGLIRQAFSQRAVARSSLAAAVSAIDRRYPLPATRRLHLGWTVWAQATRGRLDAAFHNPRASHAREDLQARGGVRIGEVASVLKPSGRYKPIYVARSEGLPLLSGRQLLQADVMGPKHIARRSVEAPDRYALHYGDVCFQADGRAEESLGAPVLVNEGRAGWLASGHVARLRPDEPAHAGWLWAAVASASVQAQLAARAAGSVVDALYESDIGQVVLPPMDEVDSASIQVSWDKFAQADALEQQARELISERLSAAPANR
ncbi:MAG: hypothetical protein LBD70_04285 [Bifidobacteriaceae bacterium]|jgi:hypothetical protein|nr:hypothetical protein [Bifidobacteriaceae bacterium]